MWYHKAKLSRIPAQTGMTAGGQCHPSRQQPAHTLKGKPTVPPPQNPNPAATAKSQRWLRGLAWAAVISAFALIILGGIVRVTGSGLGCGGDWPLCDGRLFPAMTAADIIEYSHRLVASALVGPLIIATAALAILRFRREKWLSLTAAIAVLLLLTQGGLGGVTVLTELPGPIVAAHLALAQALLGCLLLILVAAHRRPIPTLANPSLVDNRPPATTHPAPLSTHPEPVAGAAPHPIQPANAGSTPTPSAKNGRIAAIPFPRWAMLSAIAAYLLILSGAAVTATPGALAACPDWPLCQGWTLPLDHLPAVNMFHRLVAALLGLLILYTLHLGLRQSNQANAGNRNDQATGGGRITGQANRNGRPNLIRYLSLAGLIALTAQLLVGGLAVWTAFPVELRALHIALATAVWAIMAALALLTYRPLAANRE